MSNLTRYARMRTKKVLHEKQFSLRPLAFSLHAFSRFKDFARIPCWLLLILYTMNISRSKTSSPTPPEKGSFPLDHFAECKAEMSAYMNCLKQNEYVSRACLSLSRTYFKCRMDKYVSKPAIERSLPPRQTRIFHNSFSPAFSQTAAHNPQKLTLEKLFDIVVDLWHTIKTCWTV